ncbi:delta(14)-sterol reductase-like isoform X4 [Triticum dicoccoides]|uniref:delta(14)-sterol reductase-like isoform X4 n=1 Tax=Triticum dicoccoides TaxID=85692 RepID=UPI001891A01F|nr:delta(14)-sterol reductase-like isoform X4 [Triticum dicoccoides]XP_037454567.1 delta(14)-sterol reductase-like isoform X4 [Triticum dicoccoides]
MDAAAITADLLSALAPSWSAAVVLASYLAYLAAAAAALLPGKLVAVLPDSSRLHYRCNGLLPLPLPLGLSALGVYMGWMTPTVRSTVGFLASALPPHHRPVRHVEARREGQAAQAGQGRREGLPREMNNERCF